MLNALRQMLGKLLDPVMAAVAAFWSTLNARLSAALAPLLNAMRAHYRKLEPREQLLVRVAAAVVGIFLVYSLIYMPIRTGLADLNDTIGQRQHDVVEVARLMHRYQRLRVDMLTMRKRTVPADSDFSLFSVVESSLTKRPGKDKIASITPSDKKIPGGLTQYAVELKLNNLSLAQVVDTLYGLSGLKVPVTVSSLHISRRTQDPHTFDVDMTCIALGRNA